MAMRAPVLDAASAAKTDMDARAKEDPAWRALMNAPPLSAPLSEDEQKAIEAWKSLRS